MGPLQNDGQVLQQRLWGLWAVLERGELDGLLGVGQHNDESSVFSAF